MAVARTHHNKNYTCMSNYHFRDKTLSLKAKGLLSLMLSLPDTWDYSVAGLASLSSDGETSVRSAVKELEEHDYLKRTPIREGGRIVDWEYDIYEKPFEILQVENQQVENLALEITDNKVNKQLSKKEENTILSKDNITEFQFGGKKEKPKKDNLYTRCVAMVDDFTDDRVVRADLIEYLNVLLEMAKDGRPLYSNVWKGLLKKLGSLSDVSQEQHLIVRQSIERGYRSFFPVNNSWSNNSVKSQPWERGVKSDTYTPEEIEQLKKERAEMEARGEQVWF